MREPESTQPSSDELFRLAYEELKRMAHHHLRSFDQSATLSTTDLVHESYLKLRQTASADWQGRAHFFGAASRAMRQVLVDFARRRGAEKRGGDAARVSLSENEAVLKFELDDLLALDEALDRLGTLDERLRQIVELRFFGGFSQREVSELLGVAPRTVERNWLVARLFLLRELEDRPSKRRENSR